MDKLNELCKEIEKFKLKSLKMFIKRFKCDDSLDRAIEQAYQFRIADEGYNALVAEADQIAFSIS